MDLSYDQVEIKSSDLRKSGYSQRSAVFLLVMYYTLGLGMFARIVYNSV